MSADADESDAVAAFLAQLHAAPSEAGHIESLPREIRIAFLAGRAQIGWPVVAAFITGAVVGCLFMWIVTGPMLP